MRTGWTIIKQVNTFATMRYSVAPMAAAAIALGLTACAGAGDGKPLPPADSSRGASAKVPRALHPVMPAPATPASSAVLSTPDNSRCNAQAAQKFVGQPASDAIVEAARAAATPTGTVRVIAPGQAVTMDYRMDRLNIDVDNSRMIVKLYCG